MNGKLSRMDYGIFGATLAMLGFSIVLVYSSSFVLAQNSFGGADFFLERQIVRAALGLAGFMLFINVDYRFWGRHSRIGYIVSIALLAWAVLMPSHTAIHGAKRWITIGFFQFQASELALMVLVVLFAQRLQEAGDDIRSWRKFIGYVIKIGILGILIILEPNFSTACIVVIVGLSLLFVAGARFWHVGACALAALPLAVALAFGAPYRRLRILGHANMVGHKGDTGYQAYQSLIGLGHGGLFGVGLGQGGEKYFYLPEPHTDFIFSILGEEIGFAGLMVVLAIFGFIIYRGMKIALNAPDKAGRLMAFGFTFIVGIYAVVHAFVNTGIIPTTGIPLPFLSYGGMGLVFTMCSMGLLLNISSQSGPAPLTGRSGTGAQGFIAVNNGRQMP